MGYTHYWRRKEAISIPQWKAIVNDVRKLLKRLPQNSHSAGEYYANHPVTIRGPMGEGVPLVSETEIAFNGNKHTELAHDSFRIGREISDDERASCTSDDGQIFNFCKTARKPYDLLVCGVLMVCAYRAPHVLAISSDGDLADWEPAEHWVQEVLGEAYRIPETIEGMRHRDRNKILEKYAIERPAKTS